MLNVIVCMHNIDILGSSECSFIYFECVCELWCPPLNSNHQSTYCNCNAFNWMPRDLLDSNFCCTSFAYKEAKWVEKVHWKHTNLSYSDWKLFKRRPRSVEMSSICLWTVWWGFLAYLPVGADWTVGSVLLSGRHKLIILSIQAHYCQMTRFFIDWGEIFGKDIPFTISNCYNCRYNVDGEWFRDVTRNRGH